jgi:inosine/guanosine/xanthosine phosphorylase family protein
MAPVENIAWGKRYVGMAESILGGSGFRPRFGLVAGSGFHGLLKQIDVQVSFNVRNLEGYPSPGVEGHSGDILCGYLAGCEVVAFGGRVHLYEGWTAFDVCSSIFLMAAMGVETVILTNAAGLIQKSWAPGDFMVIEDHINLTGANVLAGLEVSDPTSRFIDMTGAYDPALSQRLRESMEVCGLPIRRGIYAGVCGPSFETPSEVRALSVLGADAVGMSTVQECIAARFLGMKVIGLSCLTNWAAGVHSASFSHQDVLEAGSAASASASRLLTTFLDGI